MAKRRKKQESAGAPAWMATFADMATLLMAFFVLLLAFSEMDLKKYKAVSGSMKEALGVKADSVEITISEGIPADSAEIRGHDAENPDTSSVTGKQTSEEQTIRQQLKQEIEQDKIEVEGWPDRVLIRIPEKGVFASGRATLNKDFLPVLENIRDTIAETPGSVAVAGHTDDLPIKNRDFRNNWDLATRRAVSVVNVLLEGERISPERIVAQGYADTRPIVENVGVESRARNRRVDIIVATQSRVSDLSEDGAAPEEGGEPPAAEPSE